MNSAQEDRFNKAWGDVEKELKKISHRLNMRSQITEYISGVLKSRMRQGIVDHADEDGTRDFEVMDDWNTLDEIEEELCDAVIYSANIAKEAGDVNNTQLDRLAYVLHFCVLAMSIIYQARRD